MTWRVLLLLFSFLQKLFCGESFTLAVTAANDLLFFGTRPSRHRMKSLSDGGERTDSESGTKRCRARGHARTHSVGSGDSQELSG